MGDDCDCDCDCDCDGCDGCDCDCGCDWLPCCEGCSGETNVALCCCFFPAGSDNNRPSKSRSISDDTTSAYAHRDCCYYCCCCCNSPTRGPGNTKKSIWSRLCSWCLETNVPPPPPSLPGEMSSSSAPNVTPYPIDSTSSIQDPRNQLNNNRPSMDFLERNKSQSRPEELSMSRLDYKMEGK